MKNVKTAIVLLLAAAMCFGLLSGCGAKEQASQTDVPASAEASPAASTTEDSDVAYIQQKGTLIVGITDFAPMDYKDDSGNWTGFDAEMATKVADALGVKVSFVEIDWDNKIMELDAKSIDCVWNGMTLTDEVKNSMECTKAYCNNAQVVVVPADTADKYQDKGSLADLNFAVEAGSAGEEAAKDAGLKYTSVSSQSDALMEVASGASDACIIDLLMAGAMIGEGTSYPNLKYTVKLTTEEYGVGCRKGSDLAEYINKVMADSYADSSMQTLAKKYGVQESLIEQ